MSIPTPFGGRRDASSGRAWARRLNGKPILIRHGGAPRGWRHLSQIGGMGASAPIK